MGWAARTKKKNQKHSGHLKTNRFEITSVKFLKNAFLTEEEYEDLGLLKQFGFSAEIARFNVLLVSLKRGDENKNVLCCTAGGKLTEDYKDAALTTVGRGSLFAMMHFVEQDQRVLFAKIKCHSKTHIKNRVLSILSRAQDGDGVCFVGDMAGECDGKILGGVLNPDGSVECRRFQ
ncbi:MAG: hypothetical protein ABFS56_02715 [Pseudomonadota bacterium]